jgi:hypothetical protein
VFVGDKFIRDIATVHIDLAKKKRAKESIKHKVDLDSDQNTSENSSLTDIPSPKSIPTRATFQSGVMTRSMVINQMQSKVLKSSHLVCRDINNKESDERCFECSYA